jgi:hypothetical protein
MSKRKGRGITIANAKKSLSLAGMSLVKKDDEYQVKFKGERGDAGTYFTDDLDDAIATGMFMAAHKQRWSK